MEKYTRQEVTPIERENERDETYRSTNPQIDNTRTSNNYHIIDPRGKYIEIINERLSQLNLKRKIRSDAIWMNSFVISSDGEFFKDMRSWEQYYFFEDSTHFFMDKYGAENIVSAIVHVDETTPHLHLNLIPINEGRLSSKSLFDKKSLSQLQTELWEQVGRKYGLQRGEEGSQAKHVTAAEHKAEVIVQNAEQKRRKIEEQTESKQAELDELTRTVDAVIQVAGQPIPKKKKQVADEIEALRKKNVVLEQKLNTLNQDRTSLYNEYTKEKCRADRYEKIVREVAEIKAVLPNEYENLLQEAEKVKAERFERERERNRSRFRGWDHGMEM